MLSTQRVVCNGKRAHVGSSSSSTSDSHIKAADPIMSDTNKNGLTRREASLGGAAALATLAATARATGASESPGGASTAKGARMPVAFIPHGGGPWPFVDMGRMVPKHEIEALRAYLVDLPKGLPGRPTALLVVSAHWEATEPTVMTAAAPPIYYDYGGFPPEAYTIQWPAPGAPALARRVAGLLEAAGIPTKTDASRGFDHGTFIPFKVSWPNADIPTIQLSLKSNYDPTEHLAIGAALAPLRDEGVLILGSGMSFHNFRSMRTGTALRDSQPFDAWLREAATAAPQERARRLTAWAAAPGGRLAHPQEDHLLPLMVVAGAAGDDVGRVTFNDAFGGARLSAFQFG